MPTSEIDPVLARMLDERSLKKVFDDMALFGTACVRIYKQGDETRLGHVPFLDQWKEVKHE